ncbi:MATE family efflux transporter [Bacillus sp. 123MFChir2]|uniref:MATE family efflux transporter n=1 Tax=Bacillus sp. 123MFChir2 TaxID=1169144 RepID=UPI000374F798|nr:MATE family efflux transporter [Bacillus sp. 123MFChir2]
MNRYKEILKITIPTIIEMSSTNLMGVVNLIIIGHLGYEAIAAVGITNVVILNLFALFSGIGFAVNFLVSQSYGARDFKKCVTYTYTGLYSVIALFPFFLLFSTFAPSWFFGIMGVSKSIALIGVGYLGLRIISFTLNMFRVVLNGFFRGIGNTKTPMYFSILGNTLNVILALLLVNGFLFFPKLGVLGAGWAFIVSEIVQLTGLLVCYFRENNVFPTRKLISFKEGEFKLVNIEGLKIGLEELGMSGAMLVFTIFISRVGDIELAATEIVLNVISLAYLPGIGFGVTATILLGQQLGKRRPLIAKKIGFDVMKVGLYFIVPFTIIYFLGAEYIAKLFTTEEVVLSLTAEVLRFASLFVIFDGLQLILAGGLRGIGDNSYTMKVALLLGWLMFIPISFIFTFVWELGVYGPWVGFYIYILGLFVAFGYRYLKIDWSSVEMKDTTASEECV